LEIEAIDHVQLAMPSGEEDKARAFYAEIMGLVEQAKPANLERRGGVWFSSPLGVNVHLGVEQDFRPARKAHPAFRVRGIKALRTNFEAAGYATVDDEPLPGFARFYVSDPFGNRIEFLERSSA
jgi:catechol 2,3-dioxygenase-like lactoylglutathione lyase family enzyme